MRTIEYTSRFKKDDKREERGRHRRTLDEDLQAVVFLLRNDQGMASRYQDHALLGTWVHHRDCHIKPDLILIYRLPNAESLELIRLGSHSELGL